MSNLSDMLHKSSGLFEFSNKYSEYLQKCFSSISGESWQQLETELMSARERAATIFIAGNGGSAATAITMANDLGFDIIKKTGTDKPFRFLSLCDNNSVLTAIANDVGYEHIFFNQLKIHYRKGDILLLISASGNSKNLIEAAEYVRDNGGRVISFLGFDGGVLSKISDVKVHVKSNPGEYGTVEDAHLMINHVLAHWFQFKLAK